MSCNCNLAYELQEDYAHSRMSNPDEYIGFLISDVARLMRTAFDRRVRKLGLTRAQWMVLTRLHRNSGASQSELADMMEVEKATAGRLIDRLESKGWVERRAHKADRRINRIYLTPEAERLHKRLWRIAEVTVDDALVDLSPAATLQLQELLGRVKGRLLENLENPSAKRTSRTLKGEVVISDEAATAIAVDDEVIVS
jgi:MarR family transcriptional regulator, transcriptional regulator for hemolysin